MAEDKQEEAPQERAARKGLAAEWRGLATWQKAGVIIGGGALGIAVLMYLNRQSSGPTATDASGTPPAMPPGGAVGFPGEGDQFPSLPVAPLPAGPTPGAGPTPVHPGTVARLPATPRRPAQPPAHKASPPPPGDQALGESAGQFHGQQASNLLNGVFGNRGRI